MSNPNWGRRISPYDTYARELIDEVDMFRRHCENSELRLQAQQLINAIRFSEITLASAERALASLEETYREEQES
jgi:uncharacterized protein YPO0396